MNFKQWINKPAFPLPFVINEDLRVAVEVDSSNEFTLLTLDSVEKDIQRAFKELRDAKEVYYANP